LKAFMKSGMASVESAVPILTATALDSSFGGSGAGVGAGFGEDA